METSKSKNEKPNTKLSSTPFIILILILFLILGYKYFQYKKEISHFTNNIYPVIPYIAQSVYINIYTTPSDFPKYQWFFKGTLLNNIRVSNNRGDYVMIPKTLVSIPINVFTNNNASTTRFTIQANGIEQDIQPCDFIATTY